MSETVTFREALAHMIRQYRMLRAQQQIASAAENLRKAGETGVAIQAYDLAIKIGSTP